MSNENKKAMRCRTGGSVSVENGEPVKKKFKKKAKKAAKPTEIEKEKTHVN